jgi:DeoR/GlpR family transcriptional regulator of sugar metabolism
VRPGLFIFPLEKLTKMIIIMIDYDCLWLFMIVSNPLSGFERRLELTRLLERTGRQSIAQICTHFHISEATARRDLDALSEQGLIRRVHGGAILVQQAAPEEPILRRSYEQEDEKERIGRATAALVQEGDTVFLGSGTTVLQVAHNLVNRSIAVITNSLPVINLMAGKENISLVTLGGMLRDSELSFIGHVAEQALVELRADKVIIGIRAISLEQGLTSDYLPETLTDRAILKVGREIILVADHTKCGVVSTAFLAPLNAIHTLVTDNETETEFIVSLRSQGIKVIVV